MNSDNFNLLPKKVRDQYTHLPELTGKVEIKQILNRWDGQIYEAYVTVDDVWYYTRPLGPWECTYDNIEIWPLYPLTEAQLRAAKFSSSRHGAKLYKWIWDSGRLCDRSYQDTQIWMRELFPRPSYTCPYDSKVITTCDPVAFYVKNCKNALEDDYKWEFEDHELSPWIYNENTYRGEELPCMRCGYEDDCLVPYDWATKTPGYYFSPFRYAP